MKVTADAELDELRGRYHRADRKANEEHDKQRRIVSSNAICSGLWMI
jgi:hypothetical protein